jgi:AraC-like DNA-binding protein
VTRPPRSTPLTSRREPYPRLARSWSRRRIGGNWGTFGPQINSACSPIGRLPRIGSATRPHLGCLTLTTNTMAVWEYKVISSGKGGFATPALLESFLNQLGTDEWEIVEFRGSPTTPWPSRAWRGARPSATGRSEDAAAAAARSRPTSSAWSLRRSSRAPRRPPRPRRGRGKPSARGAPRGGRPQAPARHRARLRSRRPERRPRGRLGQAGRRGRAADLLRGHAAAPAPEPARTRVLRRESTTSPRSGTSPSEVLGALKECGLEIPEDEDAKVTYVDYDGDLYWVNVNRRGELWVNTKEKSRPVFRTVQATKGWSPPRRSRGQKQPRGRERPEKHHEERKHREEAERAEPDSGAPRRALPEGPALLDRIRPLMRKNRREPGGSGSMSFLSRALKCSESTLVEAFTADGAERPGRRRRPAGFRRDWRRDLVAQHRQPRGHLDQRPREARRGAAAGAGSPARRPVRTRAGPAPSPAPGTSLPPSGFS